MIDLHCHLDLYPDPQGIVRDCISNGAYVLSVTTTPSAWEGTSRLSNGAPRIRTALGLHPELAHERSGELGLFDELLQRTKYVGEVGLDGSPSLRQHWPEQRRVFEYVLRSCSRAGGRVLSVHSRRAAEVVLDMLSEHPDAGTPVLHWFSGSLQELDRAIDMGFWFSVGPGMLRSRQGREILMRLPRDRTLTETDGPFVQIGKKTAMPADVSAVEEDLAKLWRIPVSELRQRMLTAFRLLTQTITGASR
jgi:TatD DNase family protein